MAQAIHPVDLPVKTLTEGLTMSGSKVEGVEELFSDITGW
jgi:hypothetical protein